MTVNFRWMRSSLFASVDVMEFQTTEAYSMVWNSITSTDANNNNNNNNNNKDQRYNIGMMA
jgi:hypothetical protein